MSIYILEPTITQEILAQFFERLCIAEVRKLVGHSPDFEEGFQNGYVYCMIDLFGEAEEKDNQAAYDKQESYLHIIEKIIAEHLSDLVQEIQEQGEVGLDELTRIEIEVSNAVRSYMKKNPNAAYIAVRAI